MSPPSSEGAEVVLFVLVPKDTNEKSRVGVSAVDERSGLSSARGFPVATDEPYDLYALFFRCGLEDLRLVEGAFAPGDTELDLPFPKPAEVQKTVVSGGNASDWSTVSDFSEITSELPLSFDYERCPSWEVISTKRLGPTQIALPLAVRWSDTSALVAPIDGPFYEVTAKEITEPIGFAGGPTLSAYLAPDNQLWLLGPGTLMRGRPETGFSEETTVPWSSVGALAGPDESGSGEIFIATSRAFQRYNTDLTGQTLNGTNDPVNATWIADGEAAAVYYTYTDTSGFLHFAGGTVTSYLTPGRHRVEAITHLPGRGVMIGTHPEATGESQLHLFSQGSFVPIGPKQDNAITAVAAAPNDTGVLIGNTYGRMHYYSEEAGLCDGLVVRREAVRTIVPLAEDVVVLSQDLWVLGEKQEADLFVSYVQRSHPGRQCR